MENLLQWVGEIIKTYGSWGVFVVSILEEVIAFIPSILTTMGAGFVLLDSYESLSSVFFPALFFVAIPAALGMAIGSLFIYSLAYLGEEILIDRWGKWLGISRSSVDRIKLYFKKEHTDEIILLTLRIVPIFPNSLISGVCGLLHYPIRSFLILSFIGGVIRSLPIVLLGWWAKETYIHYANILSGIENYLLVILAITAIGGLVILILKNKKK